jgi:hypothetical protein
MTYENGELTPRTTDEWLQITLEAGTDFWGTDITERENTSVHQFYEPFAAGLAELEQELQDLLQALRIDSADGIELDVLGTRLGVSRILAQKATGKVTFSRSTNASKDYPIQSGTVIQTGGEDEIQFQTTEKVTLSAGTQSVTASIEALEAGSRGNVAAGTITDAPIGINGIESITNSNPTEKGREEERDPAYRSRIQNSVGGIDSASGFQIFNILSDLTFVSEIRFIDSTSDDNSANLGSHEAEIIVDAESGHKDEIAQHIFENVPLGINLVSGNYGNGVTGSASLPNGQTFTIPYSQPTVVDIYVDMTVELTADLSKQELKREVVQYIGGIKSNGQQIAGELSIADDVVYGAVEFAIRSLDAVYDVPSLTIGTSSSPTGTSNVTIGSTERPTVDSANITVTKQ